MWAAFWIAGASIVLSLVFWLALTIGALYLIYFLLTLPMRRNERARLFLDLVELGLNDGQKPEAAIMAASASRDPALGVRFHLLAAFIEQGESLAQSLKAVPRLLPPEVVCMLKAGERIGDLRKVLPACRHLLTDGVSQVSGALNYILVLTFAITPVALATPVVIQTRIVPHFHILFDGLFPGSELPAFTKMVFRMDSFFILGIAAVFLFLWLAVLTYVGGPRSRGWLRKLAPGGVDRAVFLVPWRRKRLQRDFSCMLALLLDASVPEPEAVRLAGEAVDNEVIRHRAEAVVGALARGIKLTDAISGMDRSRELQWRLTNALHRGTGFLRALTGWHDALDAKAFQQEQAAAQLATTALVLFNGFIVASIIIAIFLALISLLQTATLW
ncbi:MAG TPA: type II secretion system F family protein [Clostridia bacterium]|nr:type II secretion system F family protein [Clostridia bacterium]